MPRSHNLILIVTLAGALLLDACESEDRSSSQSLGFPPVSRMNHDARGALQLRLETGDSEVSGFRLRVFPAPAEAIALGQAVEERYISLKATLDPVPRLPGAGRDQRFGDELFLLPAGVYTVIAQPMRSSSEPSDGCEALASEVVVFAETTSEVAMMSRCQGDGIPSTAPAAPNHAPVLRDLLCEPSPFVRACGEMTIHADATDPDGDRLGFAWDPIDAPDGALFEFYATGDRARFRPRTAGDYGLRVTVCDDADQALCSSLTFIVRVSPTEDLDGDGVGDACEPPESLCDDGADDDLDELIDCEDPDCAGAFVCCADDPQEPNDELVDAWELGGPSVLRDLVARSGDDDWFTLEVPPGTTLVARIVQDMGEGALSLRVVDAAGHSLAAPSVLPNGRRVEWRGPSPSAETPEPVSNQRVFVQRVFVQVKAVGVDRCIPYLLAVVAES